MTLPSSETVSASDDMGIIQDYHGWNEDARGVVRLAVEGCPEIRTFYVNEGDEQHFLVVEENPEGERAAQPHHVELIAAAIRRSQAS